MKSFLAVLAAGMLSIPAFANHNPNHAADAGKASGQQGAAALSEGEVRKVDKEAQKITIRHGPLANLDMPAMTMVFRVKDAAMLDQVKAGDKVKFQAEKIDGALTLTQIESAR